MKSLGIAYAIMAVAFAISLESPNDHSLSRSKTAVMCVFWPLSTYLIVKDLGAQQSEVKALGIAA